MKQTDSQPGAIAWRFCFVGIAPLMLLSVYLFVFRWSGRFFMTPSDYVAVLACSLLGTIFIVMSPLPFGLRILSVTLHIAVSLALFAFWRSLSRPVLNDIF